MDLNTLILCGKAVGAVGAIWGAFKAIARFVYTPIKTHFAKFNEIYKELKPNGGGSIKDAVSKIEASITKVESWQKARLELENNLFFDCDSSAKITWVNRALRRELAKEESELIGYGYRQAISPEDRTRVETEINNAVLGQSDLRTVFRAGPQRRCFSLELLAVKSGREILGFTGSLTRQDSEVCER